MHPNKVSRTRLQQLTDLPNIGPAMAEDLRRLGINVPQDLLGKDAYQLYESLCVLDGREHDRCVLDVFLSIVDFMQGGEPQPWWAFTAQRKTQWPR